MLYGGFDEASLKIPLSHYIVAILDGSKLLERDKKLEMSSMITETTIKLCHCGVRNKIGRYGWVHVQSGQN